MRLGSRGGSQGERRGRVHRVVAPLAVVLAAVVGSTMVAGEPAGSAERDHSFRERDRDRTRDRNRSRTRDRTAERHRGTTEAAGPGMPARFVAELSGRVVVVSAETGRVERFLTTAEPGGGARHPTVSPDGRSVWFSRRQGTCAAHLAIVPATGGAEEKVPGSGDAGPEGSPLPRPGRAQLAYARGDCNEPQTAALIIGDVEGLEGHGQIGLVPLAWNRAGDHLLAVTADGKEIRILDVNDAGGIVAIRPVDPADTAEGCRLTVIGFSPDDNDGYLALRRCGPPGEQTRRSLVLLTRDGAYRRTVVRLPRGQEFTDHIAFDPTGHSLLYSTAPSEIDGGAANQDPNLTLWLWHDGETRLLARQSPYRHPSWLP